MKKGLKVFLVVIIVVPFVIELLIQLFTPYCHRNRGWDHQNKNEHMDCNSRCELL